MKFKKVEIQAFRAYADVADGTFDFELGQDQYADFVSIYAPNGFGKTSFYDAVEWGYTGNIHRFLRKHTFNKEVAKSEKNINSLEQQYILKNRNATELDGFVKLYTTISDAPIEKKIAKLRKKGADYKFNDRETVRRYFQQVILSQEWIDAFLKEDNGSDRYQTFMDYFGDKDLDQYYRCLVSLIKTNDATINDLQAQLKGIQLQLAFNGDADILVKVNELVQTVNRLGGDLPLLAGDTTEKDLIRFSNALLAKQNECSFSQQRDSITVSFIESVFTGNDSIKNIDTYYQSIENAKKQEKAEKDLKILSESFIETDNLRKKIFYVESQSKALAQEKQALEKVIELLPAYHDINLQIRRGDNQTKELDQSISTIEKDLLGHEQGDQELRRKEEAQLKIGQEFINLLKAIPGNRFLLEQSDKEKAELIKKKGESKVAKDKLQVEIQVLEDERKSWERMINHLRNDQLDEIPSEFLESYRDKVDTIRLAKVSERNLAQEIGKQDENIKLQNQFISELEQFIAKGIDLVHRNKSSTCPLCMQDFAGYEELASRLSGNKAVSDQLKGYVDKKSEDQVRLKEIQALKRNALDLIIVGFTEQLVAIEKRCGEAKVAFEQLVKQEAQYDQIYKLVSEQSLEILNFFSGKDPVEYERELQQKVSSAEQELKVLNGKRAELSKIISQETDKLGLLKGQANAWKDLRPILTVDVAYNEVKNFYYKHFANEPFFDELFRKKLAELDKDLQTYDKELKQLGAQIDSLNKKLGVGNRDDIDAQLQKVAETKESLKQIVISFEQYVQSKLAIDVKGLTRKDLERKLNEKREQLIENSSKADKVREYCSLLLQLKENIQPYLQYERAKQTAAEIRKRIKLLKDTVRLELDTEKKKVATYIDEQINSFFYEDLINAIYKKIDPHPEYTHIKFMCDFADDKPQLNVSVTNDKRDHFLIPNLYFSTAQLNILSLSIFLAKALNAQDEKGNPIDCIFIDDPIQSMDSINVLSTIDLLRSIVVNNKKQIILSTHDENFHQLLQKKLPPDLFKSKFIELETFGKVKRPHCQT